MKVVYGRDKTKELIQKGILKIKTNLSDVVADKNNFTNNNKYYHSFIKT